MLNGHKIKKSCERQTWAIRRKKTISRSDINRFSLNKCEFKLDNNIVSSSLLGWFNVFLTEFYNKSLPEMNENENRL